MIILIIFFINENYILLFRLTIQEGTFANNLDNNISCASLTRSNISNHKNIDITTWMVTKYF